jgi:hypothetical protein
VRDERRTLVTNLQELLMGSSDRGRDDAPGTHHDPTATSKPTGGADAYANWLERMQRARARQAAITRNLYTWSNYKNWADQVRDSWAATEPSATPGAAKPKK